MLLSELLRENYPSGPTVLCIKFYAFQCFDAVGLQKDLSSIKTLVPVVPRSSLWGTWS